MLQAAGIGKPGDPYVLKMGEQVQIADLAQDLIRPSGLKPGQDIQIAFAGIRPGEKVCETLSDERIEYEQGEHPDIVCVVEGAALEGDLLKAAVRELLRLAQVRDAEAIF